MCLFCIWYDMNVLVMLPPGLETRCAHRTHMPRQSSVPGFLYRPLHSVKPNTVQSQWKRTELSPVRDSSNSEPMKTNHAALERQEHKGTDPVLSSSSKSATEPCDRPDSSAHSLMVNSFHYLSYKTFSIDIKITFPEGFHIVSALIDSGAVGNFTNKAFVDKLCIKGSLSVHYC